MSSDLKHLASSWSSIAEMYDQFFHDYFSKFAKSALDHAKLPPKSLVLDVGAGTGALTLEAAGQGHRLVSLDYSHEMIKMLDRRCYVLEKEVPGTSICTMVADAQRMTFESSIFDAIFAMFCVMFFPSETLGLTEMFRVLKPGGLLLVALWDNKEATEWNALNTQAMDRVRVRRGYNGKNDIRINYSRSVEHMAESLTEIGFCDINIRASVMHLYDVPDAENLWYALITVASTKIIMSTFTEREQEEIKKEFVSLCRKRADANGNIRLKGSATFYTCRKPNGNNCVS